MTITTSTRKMTAKEQMIYDLGLQAGREGYGERLLQANSLLRSAKSIAERKGVETNWEAFEGQVDKELKLEHPIVAPLILSSLKTKPKEDSKC